VLGLSLLFRNNIPNFNYDRLLSLTRNLILVHIVTKCFCLIYLIVFFHHLLFPYFSSSLFIVAFCIFSFERVDLQTYKCKVIYIRAVKACRGIGDIAQLIRNLDTKFEWSASRPGRCIPGETARDTHWLEGWLGSRANVDVWEESKTTCTCSDSNPV